MRVRWLIVDGYSLLHRDPATAAHVNSNLQLARRQVIRKLEKLGMADRTTIVFDGSASDGGASREPSSIDVRFSPRHQTADTVIERLVLSDPEPAGILVVTSDRAERETVTAAGAQAMSCANFLELLADDDVRVRGSLKKQARAGKPTLGDFFPDAN